MIGSVVSDTDDGSRNHSNTRLHEEYDVHLLGHHGHIARLLELADLRGRYPVNV